MIKGVLLLLHLNFQPRGELRGVSPSLGHRRGLLDAHDLSSCLETRPIRRVTSTWQFWESGLLRRGGMRKGALRLIHSLGGSITGIDWMWGFKGILMAKARFSSGVMLLYYRSDNVCMRSRRAGYGCYTFSRSELKLPERVSHVSWHRCIRAFEQAVNNLHFHVCHDDMLIFLFFLPDKVLEI